MTSYEDEVSSPVYDNSSGSLSSSVPSGENNVEAAMLSKTGFMNLRPTAPSLNMLLENLGVKGMKVKQVYDSRLPNGYNPRSIILLYKWEPMRDLKWNPAQLAGGKAGDSAGVLFAMQQMDNASATHALTLAALNVAKEDELGEDMMRLREYVRPLDSVLRGMAMAGAKCVRDAHNKAAREQKGGLDEVGDEGLVGTQLVDEFWMWMVYIPGGDGNWVFELGGLADEARVLGYCDRFMSEDWTTLAMDAVVERVEGLKEYGTKYLVFAIGTEEEKEEEEGTETESSEEGGAERTEEVERERMLHNYDTFLVEFMKLLASRGDLNELIRNQPEDFDDDMATEDEEEE